MKLDRLHILIIVFFSIISGLQAQKLGIRAGANITSMRIEQYESIMGHEPHSKMGAHFELLGYMPLSELFALESALSISTKGYTVRIEDSKKESDYPFEIFGKRNLTYLEIPLRAKVQKKMGKFDYFAAVGPQMSIGLIGKWNTEKDLEQKNTIEVKQTKWNDVTDVNSLKRLDFGLFASLGMEYKSLMVEFSYTGSLGNNATVDGIMAKHKVFSLSVGRYFVKSVHPKLEPEKKKSKYRKISSKKKKKKRRRRR